MKLEDITLALNEGKPTDIYNGQRRWFPVFWSNEGPSAFASSARFAIARMRLRGRVPAFRITKSV